jgi:hypothetical protein
LVSFSQLLRSLHICAETFPLCPRRQQ